MDTREVWVKTGIDHPWKRERNTPALWGWVEQLIEDGVYVSVASDEDAIYITLD